MADGGSAILRGDPGYLKFDALPNLAPVSATPPVAPASPAPPSSALSDPAGTVATDAQTDAAAQPPPANPWVEKFTQAQENYFKSLEGATKQLNGIKFPDMQKIEESVKPFQAPPRSNPMQGWGGAAMVFAAFGSLLTRRPLTTAMNAMAGALDAFKKGDQEALDNSYKIWQANTENAIKLGNFELEAYHAAVQSVTEKLALGQQLSEAEQMNALAQINATAAALGNTNMQQIIAAHGLPGTLDALARQSQMVVNLTKSQDEVQQLKRTNDAFAEWKAGFQQANGRLPTAMEAQAKWKELSNQYTIGADLTQDALDQAADQEMAGDHSWKYNVGRGIQGPANIAAVMNRAAEKRTAQGLTGSDAAAATAKFKAETAEASAAGRRLGATVPSVIEAEKFAQQALQASAAVPRGKFVPLNQAALLAKQKLSSPEVAAFVVANTSLIQAYAAAVSRTGVPTDKLREHAYEMLSIAMSPEAYAAAIAQMKKELELARDAPEEFINQLGERIAGRPVSSGSADDKPPIEGARKAPDGNWYVTNPDGSYSQVVQ